MKFSNVFVVFLFAAVALNTHVCQAEPLEDLTWEEVRSENFVVYSSVERQKVVDFLKYMELFYALVPKLTTIDTSQVSVPTRILFVQKKSELRQLGIQPSHGGGFLEGLRNNLIVVRESKFDHVYEAIYYLYIKHLINSSSSASIPGWVSEGFAQYLRTIVMEDDGRSIKVGRLSKITRRGSTACGWESATDLLRDKVLYGCKSGIRASRLVRQLLQDPNMRVQLNDYFGRLSNGEDKLSAFSLAFDVSLDQFNADVLKYSEKTLLPSHTLYIDKLLDGFKTTSQKLNREDAALVLGLTALRTRQLANATHWLTIAASAPKHRARALSALGVLSVFEIRLDEAQKRFNEALKLDPENIHILLDTARLSFRRAYDETDVKARDQHLLHARRYIGKAWKLNDKQAETYAMYGRSFLLQQNDAKAIDTLEASVRLLPSHAGVLLDLAQAYQRLGRQDDAIKLADTVVRRSHLVSSELQYVYAASWKATDDSRIVRKRDEIEYSRNRIKVQEVEAFWY